MTLAREVELLLLGNDQLHIVMLAALYDSTEDEFGLHYFVTFWLIGDQVKSCDLCADEKGLSNCTYTRTSKSSWTLEMRKHLIKHIVEKEVLGGNLTKVD